MFLGTTFTRTAMASSCKHKDTLLNAIEDDDTDLAIDLINQSAKGTEMTDSMKT